MAITSPSASAVDHNTKVIRYREIQMICSLLLKNLVLFLYTTKSLIRITFSVLCQAAPVAEWLRALIFHELK